MSTAAQLIVLLVPLTGLLPSTLDRVLRALRQAGMVPAGGPGGGKNSAHFEVMALVYALLALVGLQPSDGPDAVRTLRPMLHRGTDNKPAGVPDALPTLEDMLAHWIEHIASILQRGIPASDPGFDTIRSIKIAFCLDPQHAIITLGPEDNETTIVYAGEETTPRSVQRLYILKGEMLIAAGELLADTIEQHAAIATLQLLAQTKPAKASQENENAGNLRQEVPAPSDDPRVNGGEANTSPNSINQAAAGGSTDQSATCGVGGFRSCRQGSPELKSLQGCTRELVALL